MEPHLVEPGGQVSAQTGVWPEVSQTLPDAQQLAALVQGVSPTAQVEEQVLGLVEVSQRWVEVQQELPQVKEGAWQEAAATQALFWHNWPAEQQLVPQAKEGAVQAAAEMQEPAWHN